ncbi:protein containing DUF929, partial [mine drainage metagenome]
MKRLSVRLVPQGSQSKTHAEAPEPRWGSGWMVRRLIPTVLLVVMGFGPIVASASPRFQVGAAVPSRILQELSQISRNGLQDTAPPNNALMNAIAGALVHSHRPRILYVGADYCPYCAALRWPLVLTLLRFGSLEGLKFMRSSSTDVFADTATFSFYGSTYKSPWIGFEGFETSTRTGRPLMRPPHPV